MSPYEPYVLPLFCLCLRKQLDELHELRARFAAGRTTHGTTVRLADNGAEAVFERYIKPAFAQPEFPNAQLHYTFAIDVPTPPGHPAAVLDVHVTPPLWYPAFGQPTVSVLSSAHTNEVLRTIRLDAERFLVNLSQLPSKNQTCCVQDLVLWLQQNIGHYSRRPAPLLPKKALAAATAVAAVNDDNNGIGGRKHVVVYPLAVQRIWVRVAHLSCNNMRQNALRLAKRLRLGGFQRPGWPGYLCVEGPRAQTQEWWRQIRHWHWQKIAVRRTDDAVAGSDEEAQRFRRFRGPYRDLDVANQVLAGAVGKHCEATSTGMFVKFLERNQCADAMVALFGARGGQYSK